MSKLPQISLDCLVLDGRGAVISVWGRDLRRRDKSCRGRASGGKLNRTRITPHAVDVAVLQRVSVLGEQLTTFHDVELQQEAFNDSNEAHC